MINGGQPAGWTVWARLPFGREQMLRGMIEELRSHDWDVTGSLSRSVTSEQVAPDDDLSPEADAEGDG